MRNKCHFLLLILFTTNFYCQIPNIENNYSKSDSLTNPLLKTFLKEFEFVLAYSDVCCSKEYKIIGLKNGKWNSWTYSDNFIQWTKKKGESGIKVDTIKTGTFLEGEKGKKIKKNNVKKLLTKLSEIGFWELKNDSLNQSRVIKTYIEDVETINRKAIITDGTNYVFDLISKNKFRKIQSYYPEYFVKLFPDMIDRKKFIESRDYFLNWWEKYSH
jgi:hypothetical protein